MMDMNVALGPIVKRWAVLVGINTYSDAEWSTLRYCVADVVALEGALEALGFEAVVCLRDDGSLQPTKELVKAALRDLQKWVGPNDLVFVHFACHGKVCEVEDGSRKPFLAMKHSMKEHLAEDGWSVEQVEQWMRESGAKRLFLSLDACHTGVDMGRGVDDDAEFLYYAYDVLPEGLAVLSASTAQQQAKEMAGLGHGVYTYYLLEALSGKAVSGGRSFITVGDIERYVRVEMERFQRKNLLAIQEPTKWSVGRGAEDMKVVDRTGIDWPTITFSSESADVLKSEDYARGDVMENSRALEIKGIKREIAELSEDYNLLHESYVKEKDAEMKKSYKDRYDAKMIRIKALEVQLKNI
jgi:hypothetical protein